MTFTQMDLETAVSYLNQRKGGWDWIVLHHMLSPNQSQWRGEASMWGIRRHHMGSNSWSEIGGTIAADPDGMFWNMRPLSYSNQCHAIIRFADNRLPAALQGKDAGVLNYHGIGIEMVGDYATEDPTTSKAVSAALDLTARMMVEQSIPMDHVIFHRDVSQKSHGCPGLRISHSWVRAELEKRLAPQPAAWAEPAWDMFEGHNVIRPDTDPRGVVTAERLAVFMDRLLAHHLTRHHNEEEPYP